MKLDNGPEVRKRFSMDRDKLWPTHMTSPQHEPYMMDLNRAHGTIRNSKMSRSLDFHDNGKVIMKMDVTYFEHPFIIGKGGNIIKRISEYTNCLIHFPDANRYGLGDKSNQVSITGYPKDVEKARFLIRALIPVVINFTIPLSNFVLVQLYPNIGLIETTYGLSISFKIYDKFSLLVTIRCSQIEFHHSTLGILCLMDLLGIKSNEIPVSIKTEILWPQQNFVIGTKNSNIKKIMHHTGARITLPNRAARIDKNSFIITGKLECVFIAWKELMDHLPVIINFDVHEAIEIKDEFEKLFCNEGTRIDTRPKPRHNSKTVIIKGPERLSKNLLQYRQVILGLPKICFDDETKEENFVKCLMITASESFVHSNTHNPFDYSRENLSSILNENPNFIHENPNLFHQQELNDSPQSLASNSFMDSLLFGNEINSPLSLKPSSTNVLSRDQIFHQAMHRPIDEDKSSQVPSSSCSGLYFSQSRPAAIIEKHKIISPNEESSMWRTTDPSSQSSINCKENISKDKSEIFFSYSNCFDAKKKIELFPLNIKENKSLAQLLWKNGLENYIENFENQEIDYQAFLSLNLEDLQNMGLKGESEKIMALIRRENLKRAPGAERYIKFN